MTDSLLPPLQHTPLSVLGLFIRCAAFCLVPSYFFSYHAPQQHHRVHAWLLISRIFRLLRRISKCDVQQAQPRVFVRLLVTACPGLHW